jgi:hypothetical protein
VPPSVTMAARWRYSCRQRSAPSSGTRGA